MPALPAGEPPRVTRPAMVPTAWKMKSGTTRWPSATSAVSVPSRVASALATTR